jgi:hypothetical protein
MTRVFHLIEPERVAWQATDDQIERLRLALALVLDYGTVVDAGEAIRALSEIAQAREFAQGRE